MMTLPDKTATQGRSRRSRWILIGIVAIAAISVLLLLRGIGDDDAGNANAISSSGTSKRDDMAGMDMSSDGTVRLTAAQIQQFGVTFDTVTIRTMSNEVRTTASIVMDETRVAQITSKFSGFVERLHVNSTGQRVQRGQAVASLFSPELLAAQQELLLASRLDRSLGKSSVPGSASNSPNLLAAARQRLRLWDVSDSEINSILRTGNARRTVTLFAPAGGIVTEKRVVQGQSVVAGEPLMTVADLSTVWAIAELRESDARATLVGASVTAEVNSYPGEKIQGRIAYIYPTLDEQSRTVRARVVLANPGGRLKPGMFATVTISSPSVSSLTVPAAALVETGERSYVFVRMPDGELMPHDVRIGRRTSGFVEILSGVEAGEIVVTSAQFLLDSESNIGDVMRSMIGQGRQGTMGGMPGRSGEAGSPMKDKGADMKGMQMPPAARR